MPPVLQKKGEEADMHTFDQVAAILDDIVDALPADLIRGLNGGIYLLPDTVRSSKIPDPHYYVLGEYRTNPVTGRMIYLKFVISCA